MPENKDNRGRKKKPTNAFCPTCRHYYRRPPSHEHKQKRCPKCSKGMRGKQLDWVDPTICPVCTGYKFKRSGVCRECYIKGHRVRKITVIEELIKYAES